MGNISISNIEQIDNYTFSITWSDGSLGRYRLSALQKVCPCAQCSSAISPQPAPQPVNDEVRAVKIHNVGSYALKIQFSSGCSTGIYPYQMLYDIMSPSQ